MGILNEHKKVIQNAMNESVIQIETQNLNAICFKVCYLTLWRNDDGNDKGNDTNNDLIGWLGNIIVAHVLTCLYVKTVHAKETKVHFAYFVQSDQHRKIAKKKNEKRI